MRFDSTTGQRRSTPSNAVVILMPAARTTAARRAAPPDLTVEGSLSLRQAGQVLGGADRVALLEAIGGTGSMTRAAREVGISYKTAWDRVQAMNNLAPQPLVQRRAGGAGGGGTALTPYAQGLVAAFRELERDHHDAVGRLARNLAAPRDLTRTMSTLGQRTSARNQLGGTVVAVQRGAVNAALELRLPGGADAVHATLTLASLKELAIRRGTEVVALIKAPSVMLALDSPALRISVRNRLAGTVRSLRVGAVHTEVQVRLAGGQTMVAMLDRDAAQRLGLARGTAVRVLFQESSVILGVV